MQHYRTVLTIAGSDSGGGAGIQADLKAIGACGCYGSSAITAITAQNTIGVQAIHPIPLDILEQQIRAVLDDIGADAIKIGMLHSRQVIACVARVLDDYAVQNIVLDPVMVATSGDRLIEEDAVAAMEELLIPRVRLITPNLAELRILARRDITSPADLEVAAAALGRRHGLSVLAKAGHFSGDQLSDLLFEYQRGRCTAFSHRRIVTNNSHGTGCTLSSAIAAHLAKGLELSTAVKQGIDYLSHALEAGSAYQLGRGHGPVHHYHAFWR